MRSNIRATVFIAAALSGLGCKARQAEPAPVVARAPATDAAPIGKATSSAVDAKLEACKLRMTAPEAHEWTTYWDPKDIEAADEGPSNAHSIYWANAKEKESLLENKSAIPLDISCGTDGAPDMAISLAAINSTEKDVPMAPGKYRIVGKQQGKVRPGEFFAGALMFENRMFDATRGTLTIEDFDASGVKGSFGIEGREIVAGSAPLKVEGTFEIPCRGGMFESECKANKVVARH